MQVTQTSIFNSGRRTKSNSVETQDKTMMKTQASVINGVSMDATPPPPSSEDREVVSLWDGVLRGGGLGGVRGGGLGGVPGPPTRDLPARLLQTHQTRPPGLWHWQAPRPARSYGDTHLAQLRPELWDGTDQSTLLVPWILHTWHGSHVEESYRN